MTLEEFIKKYDGKGIDYDGAYGFQCMDLYRQYVKDVIGGKQSPAVPGAKDVWNTYLSDVFTRTTNKPDNAPKPGDVVIWGEGIGPYGHIAVCSQADSNNFTSFDQNYPLGSVCHLQKHTYFAVAGWLHPKNTTTPPEVPIEESPDKIKVDLGDDWGVLEVQAIRSILSDQKKTIEGLTRDVGGLQAQVDALKKNQQGIAEKLNCPNSHDEIMKEIDKLITTEDQSNGVSPEWGLVEFLKKLFHIKGGEK
jgi:hypothetical protein